MILDPDNPGPRIVAIDTGIKDSIVRNLRERGVRLELHPCTTSVGGAARALARTPSSSPTARATRPRSTTSSSRCAAWWARCRCSASAWGTSCCAGRSASRPSSCPFGHRGANHPVKDLQTGKIDITSQNHGFAVRGPGGETRVEDDEPVRWDTDFGVAELSHVNLYDRTVEGLLLRDVRGATAQYHPEAGPGPHDALYLFDRYLEMVG